MSLSNLTPGQVRIEVSHAGYASLTVLVTANGGQTLDISTSLDAVPPGAPQVFSLRGRITDDATDAPIANANILVTGEVTASALSDGTGGYVLDDLPLGSFAVTVSAPGYHSAGASAIAQPFQSIEFSPALVASSIEPTSLRGVIVDAQSGEPIEGASVLVVSGAGSRSAQSAPNGGFAIRDLTAEETLVTIEAAGYQARSLTFTPSAGFLNDLGSDTCLRAPEVARRTNGDEDQRVIAEAI